jgi:hypothetical protein
MRAAALLLVAAVVTGCGGGDDQVSDDRAVASLEQQRDDVRGLATELTTALGPASESWGRYEGCDSAFNDVYRNFRYLAQLRVDATDDAGDPSSLDQVLADADLTRDEAASEPDKLRATRDDLSVSFWSLPAGGLLVTVQGPCVDVPEDARAEWTKRGRREQLA